MPKKLTASQVKPVRLKLLRQQNSCDPLTGKEITDPVLDHCHSGGHVRAVLDRWSNSVLGRVENWARRSGVDYVVFLRNCADYLEKHREDQTGLIHPTHKTAAEKAALRQKRARAKRKAAKEQA